MLKYSMLAVYILLGLYMIWHLIRCAKKIGRNGLGVAGMIILIILYLLCASTIFFGSFLPASPVQTVIRKISNIWVGFLIYAVFFSICLDILHLVFWLINKKHPLSWYSHNAVGALAGVVVVLLSVVMTIYGTIHARKLYTDTYEVTVNKKVEGLDSLHAVLVGDTHYGHNFGLADAQRLVDRINELQPEIVIFAGDMFDNDYDAITDPDAIAQCMAGIKTKYGAYTIFGNHDVSETLVGGFPVYGSELRDPRMDSFMDKSNLIKLVDTTMTIADGEITLIGRLDEERAGDGTKNRKTMEQLLEGVDMDKPVLVVNHEPHELKEYAAAGTDVLFCGHTHAGQFFPLTIVQPIAWANWWGLKQVEQMYNFTTSGFGVYGPALRVGTNSEVVDITIHFAG